MAAQIPTPRRYKRGKAGYPGALELEDGELLPIRIIDLTPRGARISGVKNAVALDTIVRMSWEQGRSVRQCRVMWVNGNSAGLAFL
jgi:hypothetical protein